MKSLILVKTIIVLSKFVFNCAVRKLARNCDIQIRHSMYVHILASDVYPKSNIRGMSISCSWMCRHKMNVSRIFYIVQVLRQFQEREKKIVSLGVWIPRRSNEFHVIATNKSQSQSNDGRDGECSEANDSTCSQKYWRIGGRVRRFRGVWIVIIFENI